MFKRSLSTLRVPFTSETYALQRHHQFKRLGSEDFKVFESIVGYDHVLGNEHDIDAYNTDWTRKYRGQSSCVLRPKTPSEISRILAYCNQHSIAVVPQGGNTGLVGGSVPVFDEIVLSTSRLNAITNFDAFSGILSCQAGCVLETLDNYLAERGYMMPLGMNERSNFNRPWVERNMSNRWKFGLKRGRITSCSLWKPARNCLIHGSCFSKWKDCGTRKAPSKR